MFKDKFKAYKFSIVACIFGTIITGITYITYGYWYMGLISIFSFLTTVLNIACFRYEKKKEYK
ncbi:MAG: hypothetical protein K0R15_2414 [Clostridiales bacterium]|jgi:uncharacterized membrane protein|nr:hypothetical protein [Clostridiales bacterium]